MVEEIDPKNHGEDLFYVTLANQTVRELLDYQYAAIRMSNLSADSNTDTYQFYRELAKKFDNAIDKSRQDLGLSPDNTEVRLNGPEALYLHRSLVSRMEEAQNAGQDSLGDTYRQYCRELRQKIAKTGGGQAVKQLEELIQAESRARDS
jgi:hypothetical protein